MDGHRRVGTLIQALQGARLSRRQLMKRSVAAGVSSSAVAPFLAGRANRSVAAQEEAPRFDGVTADITERKHVEGRNRLLVALDDAVRSLADPAEIMLLREIRDALKSR